MSKNRRRLRKSSLLRVVALVAVVAASPALASSGTIYSNMAVFPFATGLSISVEGSDFYYNGWASPFTSPGDFSVSQIDVAVGTSTPTAQQVDVGIYEDSGGLPGILLGSLFTVNVPALLPPSTPESIAVTGITLSAGGQYWLAVLPPSSDTFALWWVNTNLTGTIAGSFPEVPWVALAGNSPGEFDVLGSAVATPEPSALLLLIVGLFGIVAFRKARRASRE